MAALQFPSPTIPISDERQVLLGYLDFFREVVRTKVGNLPPTDQGVSALPSGWTPLELMNHLRHVERRWLQWGFAGEAISDPWADELDGRWHTDETFATLSDQMDQQAAVTRAVVESHDLEDVGQPGERWDGAAPAPLRRVLLHLVQEYARHCGHIDVVREIVDGSTGEA
jgi:hypothetical protein